MSTQFPSPGTSRFDPLSALWRVATAPQTLMALLALVALVLVLGSQVPQLPPEAEGNPQAWLAVQPELSGPAGELIRILQLYDIYDAFWVQLLLALTGLVAFVRAVESAELAWHAKKHENWQIDDLAWWKRAGAQAELPTSLSSEAALARASQLLAEQKYRWSDVATTSQQGLVAVRRALLLWAQPVAYAALLVVMVGLIIAGAWGWQNKDWIPTSGDKRPIGRGTPLSVRLDSFGPPEGQDGDLQQYRSEITWFQNGQDQVQDSLTFGNPAHHEGVAVRQVGYVPVATVSVWDESDKVLSIQASGEEARTAGELQIAFSSTGDQPLVFVSNQERFLALSFEPECTDGKPALLIDLLQGGGEQKLASGSLRESGSLSLDNLEIKVKLAYRPVLRTDHRPAAGLTVGGMILVVAALAVGWLLPPHLVWLAPETDETGLTIIQLVIPPSLRHNRWQSGLAAKLGEVLADDD